MNNEQTKIQLHIKSVYNVQSSEALEVDVKICVASMNVPIVSRYFVRLADRITRISY